MMAAEHALLGLLAISEAGGSHGYELARRFAHGEPLGDVIRLEPGMVYHHLKKLERRGWAVAVADPAGGRPARRVFALTDGGRAELERWLSEPVAHTREIRLEFLIKLYFALLLDPQLAVRLIDEQRAMMARLAASLKLRSRGESTDEAASFPERWFGDLVFDMRLAQTRAALAWLERVRGETADRVGVNPR
jgi:DNA-binding PadR family transcriptional regulator